MLNSMIYNSSQYELQDITLFDVSSSGKLYAEFSDHLDDDEYLVKNYDDFITEIQKLRLENLL